jgi:hypothetical protein
MYWVVVEMRNSYDGLRTCAEWLCKVEKSEAAPATGRGGSWTSETSRLPHFVDNRFKDGVDVVSLTRRPPFTPRKIRATHIR